MGGNNFHSFAANLYPRKGRGCRHVVSLVCHDCTPGWVGTFQGKHRTSNAERRTPNVLLVDLLYFARVRVSGERADWMDAPVNGCARAKILSSGPLCRTFQIRPRTLAHVSIGLPLGNSGACSHARRIFPGRDWKTCGRTLGGNDGRTWCIIRLDVSGVTALLFFNCVRQFFPLVDQTAGALEKPARATRWHRSIFVSWHVYDLRNFHAGADQTTSLHLAGLSIAGAAAGATL